MSNDRFFDDFDLSQTRPDFVVRGNDDYPLPGVAIDASPTLTASINVDWLPHIIGLLNALDQSDAWNGDSSTDWLRSEVNRMIALLSESESNLMSISVGMIIMSICNPGDGWLPCNGDSYSPDDYPALHAVLPDSLKVSSVEFITPDFVNTFPRGTNLYANVGLTGGEAEHTLTVDEMPAHTHGVVKIGTLSDNGVNRFKYAKAFSNGAIDTNSTGGGQAHNNIPPYCYVIFWIRAE